jgi:chloride channel 3/4/5
MGIVVEVLQKKYPGLIFFSSCEADVACLTPGVYAIIGAASALGGVTRMTVSIVVIMFELTGALTYVLPIMIAVMISKWVGDAMGKRGIYESWIRFNGYPLLDNRDDTPVPICSVSEVMTRVEDLVLLTASGHTLQTLSELLANHPYRGFPVVSDSREVLLLGYISRAELAYAISSALSAPRSLPLTTEAFFSHQTVADYGATLDLRPWMDQTPITLSSKSSLQLAVNLFQKLGLRYVLFCDKGVLRGLLTKKDLWYVLNGPGERAAVEERSLLGGRPPVVRDLLDASESELMSSPELGR